MTLHVQYTAADFREANTAVRGQRLHAVSTAPMFFVIVAGIAGGAVGNFLQKRPPGEPEPDPLSLVIWLFPMALLSAYWGITSSRGRGWRAHGFVTPPPPLRGVGVGLPALIVVLVFALSVLANASIPPGPPSPPSPPMPIGQALATLFLPFASAAAMLTGSVVLFMRVFAGNVRRAFDLQVHLHRPTTLEITPESLVVSSDGTRQEYAWRAIIGWNETPNLFLLFTSYVTFHMVPKRDIPSRDAYDHLSAILRQNVGERRHGFDVLPASAGARATPPPVPNSQRAPIP